MLRADKDIKNSGTCAHIDGRWVAARPLPGGLLSRIKDAWQVVIGKADAVKFYKQ